MSSNDFCHILGSTLPCLNNLPPPASVIATKAWVSYPFKVHLLVKTQGNVECLCQRLLCGGKEFSTVSSFPRPSSPPPITRFPQPSVYTQRQPQQHKFPTKKKKNKNKNRRKKPTENIKSRHSCTVASVWSLLAPLCSHFSSPSPSIFP